HCCHPALHSFPTRRSSDLKHTANVRDGLNEIRRIIEGLIAKRDARRDGFVEVLKKAMTTRLGDDAEEVAKRLGQEGIPRNLAKEDRKSTRLNSSHVKISYA